MAAFGGAVLVFRALGGSPGSFRLFQFQATLPKNVCAFLPADRFGDGWLGVCSARGCQGVAEGFRIPETEKIAVVRDNFAEDRNVTEHNRLSHGSSFGHGKAKAFIERRLDYAAGSRV